MNAGHGRFDISSAHAHAAGVGEPTPSWIDLHERERVRLGFDLHDGPMQTLAAALLQVRMMHDLSECVCDEACSASVTELEATLAEALDQMYSVIEALRGCPSDSGGLIAPVQAHVESFAARFGIAVDLTVEGDEVPVSPSLKIAVFRIVQEALSNVLRHAGTDRARIRLSVSPQEVICEVADDGCGFDPSAMPESPMRRGTLGLTGMRERARLLDGTVEILSAPGQGTTVRARIPVWQA